MTRRAALLALALWATAGACLPSRPVRAAPRYTVYGAVTWYRGGYVTYYGEPVIAGYTAACGWGYDAFATVTLPDGASYVCTDRGGRLGYWAVDVYGEADIPARMAACGCAYACPIE